jgi:ribosomal subunit interface protein
MLLADAPGAEAMRFLGIDKVDRGPARLWSSRPPVTFLKMSSVMKLSVKGKQIDVGDALRTHVKTHLEEVVGRYYGDSLEATVTFSRDAHLFRADILMHGGRGVMLQSTASSDQPYPAFDSALARLSGRLRRHKTKIKQHHHDTTLEQVNALVANSFVLNGDVENSEEEVGDNPTVVAEMTTPVETLTVGEAVMRLDLGDLTALLFRNRGHGGLNMIYRRPDGNIGWVDPAESAAARKA